MLVAATHNTRRAFQTFGNFSSGNSVHYEPSLITSTTHQASASHLVIGQRLLPQIAIRAADSRPVEIQDLCPADTRFKVIVFTGPAHGTHLDAISAEMARADGWLHRFGGNAVFEVVTVCQGNKDTIEWISVPEVLRPHWTKSVFILVHDYRRVLTGMVPHRVLLDDTDTTGKEGGKMYKTYGIGSEGAVVIVRPDGYVANVVPLDQTHTLDAYFGAFLKPRDS